MPADEIVIQPPQADCLTCHNERSPTYKPFCFHHEMPEIRHINPKKERTSEELAALDECRCEAECVCAESCATQDETEEAKEDEEP